MIWAALAGGAAVILLLMSFVALRGRDNEQRLADHLSRTMAQMGITIGSVGAAVAIFLQQSHQQDVRQFRQTALSASAVLKSTMASVSLEVEELLQLRGYVAKTDCVSLADCRTADAPGPQFVNQKRLLRYVIAPEPLRRKFFIDDAKYAERIRTLVMTHSVFGERAMSRMLSSAYSYEVNLLRTKTKLRALAAQLPEETEKWANISPNIISLNFDSLAELQRSHVVELGNFVCELEEIDQSISNPAFFANVEPFQGIQDPENHSYTCEFSRNRSYLDLVGSK